MALRGLTSSYALLSGGETRIALKRETQKKENQFLIAAGCLSEREKENLIKQLPGIDVAFGTRRWADILKMVEALERGAKLPFSSLPDAAQVMADPAGVTRAASMGASAYLKIADGCDRGCAFCSIPFIKGRMISRVPEDILNDAIILQSQGVK